MLLQISDQSVILMQTYVLHEDQFREGLEWAFSLFTMFKKIILSYQLFFTLSLVKVQTNKKTRAEASFVLCQFHGTD